MISKRTHKKNITIKKLENNETIENACALLYKVHFEEAGWIFSPDNPSQLRVELRNNQHLLVDRFTDQAIWFGAFDDSRLVGCIRLTLVDENNKFEMEGYENSVVIREHLLIDKSHCMEMTRAAVLRSHNGQGIVRRLFLAAFQYCQDNQYSVCTTTNNGYLIALFKNIGCPLKMELAFKYEEQDPMPVNFYFIDYYKSEIKNLILNLAAYKKDTIPNDAKLFSTLETIAPILPTLIYWHDTKGVVLGLNAICSKAMGLPTQNIIGKTPYEFYPKEVAEHILNHNERVIKTGEISSQDEQITQPSTGEIKVYRSTKAPLYNDEGEIIGVIGSSIDVTTEKEAEKTLIIAKEAAEAANRSKTEFVQNMQHDIRTPSAGLWGVLDVLAKAEPEGSKREALEMAALASKRLLDLCNDAVAFGNLEAHTKPRVERDLDIRALVQSVIELNKPAAFAKKIAIHLKIASSVPPHIASDEFRLSRILINLLGNSIKFSHQGTIKINAEASLEESTRQGILSIEIKDSGIGIAREKVDKIFEKFSRGVASNTNQYSGSGLGLYVVKTFMDELDGDIYVDSRENEGTYFKLDIPFKGLLADRRKPGLEIDEHFNLFIKEEEMPYKEDKKSFTRTPFNHALLIIEDDKTCLFAEKNVLSAYTHKIDSAENVKQALEKLAARHYDLVISDLGLPDGSGNDIVTKIKTNPESLNYETHFVAMTAHQDAEKHQEAIAAGFDAIGTKPLNTEKTIEWLKTYPAKHEAIELAEEWPSVIDLALGMQRIGAKSENDAVEALKILHQTLQEDIPTLKEAQKSKDMDKAQEILHKIRGGLCYSGTPRLEEACKLLQSEMQYTSDFKKTTELFMLVYHEANLFREEFIELMAKANSENI